MTPETAVTIDDLRDLARRWLPTDIYLTMEDGNGDGRVPNENVQALDRWRLTPRMLVDRTNPTMQTSLFGKTYDGPFGISATGMGPLFRRGSERMLAETAKALNIPYILSGASGASLEEIAKVAPDHLWFQLYAATDRTITESLVARARDAGVKVLVMTVDTPLMFRSDRGRRDAMPYPPQAKLHLLPKYLWEAMKHPGWMKAYFQHGGMPMMGNYVQYAPKGAGAPEVLAMWASQMASDLTWDDVALVRRLWPGTLVIKGILHPADAVRAVELGADAVTVSNHGGRTFDRAPTAIDALPLIKEAIGSRATILFDSGIRRGSHVIVARCLGAQFCFTGRATLYGVSAGGRAGATRAVELLRAQIKEMMTWIGCRDFNELGPQFLAGQTATFIPV